MYIQKLGTHHAYVYIYTHVYSSNSVSSSRLLSSFFSFFLFFSPDSTGLAAPFSAVGTAV